MLITRTSIFSNITRTRDLPVTEEQMKKFLNKEDLVQNIFPHLSPSDREFIMTGITSEEWDEEFLREDEELDDNEAPF